MKIKTLVLILMLIAGSSVTSSAIIVNDIETKTTSEFLNNWKEYPYNPPGTTISFPRDEGRHYPYLDYPKEWWYANFHLTGNLSGVEYGAFIAFSTTFSNYFFSISDLNEKKMYSTAKIGLNWVSDDKLDILFVTPFTLSSWYTKKDGEDLIPFQYRLIAKGTAREDNEKIELDVDMHCLKPPLIVGGDGLVEIANGWSYYYSQTKIKVIGKISVHGITEEVTGYAWIDHQWGDFNVGLTNNRVTWEWFSIKLDDFREIMVADTWWIHNDEYYGPSYDGLNLFNQDFSLELLKDYKITQLDFWTDPISKKTFAIQWRITEPTKQIDLLVTADFPEQVLHLTRLIDKFFPLLFWEGSCSVIGSIEGNPVSGKAYVESCHSYKNNNFFILNRFKLFN